MTKINDSMYCKSIAMCVYSPADTDKKEENEQSSTALYLYIILVRPKVRQRAAPENEQRCDILHYVV